jgi:transcriptional regulator with XRE-family HTH domain
MTLGQQIRRERENRGMTLAELASASKLTHATLSRLETGHVKELRSEALKRLAESLDVSMDYLVGKDTAMDVDEIVRSDRKAHMLVRAYAGLPERAKPVVANFMVGSIKVWIKLDADCSYRASDPDTEREVDEAAKQVFQATVRSFGEMPSMDRSESMLGAARTPRRSKKSPAKQVQAFRKAWESCSGITDEDICAWSASADFKERDDARRVINALRERSTALLEALDGQSVAGEKRDQD